MTTHEALNASREYTRTAEKLETLRAYRDNLPADILCDLGIGLQIHWNSSGAGHREIVAGVRTLLAVKLRGMIDDIIDDAHREERLAKSKLSEVLGADPTPEVFP